MGQWSDVKPCGTLAALRRHYRRGEPVDEACREAQSRAKSDYYAKQDPVLCLDCGELKRARTRGLCAACYERNRVAGTLSRFPRKRKGK